MIFYGNPRIRGRIPRESIRGVLRCGRGTIGTSKITKESIGKLLSMANAQPSLNIWVPFVKGNLCNLESPIYYDVRFKFTTMFAKIYSIDLVNRSGALRRKKTMVAYALPTPVYSLPTLPTPCPQPAYGLPTACSRLPWSLYPMTRANTHLLAYRSQ